MIIPDLLRLFPRARFVFLLRNPMSVLSSVVRSFVTDDYRVLSEFRKDLLEAPQQIVEGIALAGEQAIVVRYEELVADPETEMRALCDRLNVEFSVAMLDYSDTPEAKGFMTDRVGIHQSTRPVAASLNKWKAMVDDPQLLHFARQYLQELPPETLAKLGYSYNDVLAVIGTGKRNPAGLYPWRLAINNPEFFSLRDRFTARRYDRCREKGLILGQFFTLWDLVLELGRRLRMSLDTIR
jgi:hypothetical protein